MQKTSLKTRFIQENVQFAELGIVLFGVSCIDVTSVARGFLFPQQNQEVNAYTWRVCLCPPATVSVINTRSSLDK